MADVMGTAGWQACLDANFPAGLELNYLPPHPHPDYSARIIAWIEVDDVVGEAPLFTLYPAGIDRQPIRETLLAYEVRQASPVLLWRVHTHHDYAMTWTAIDPAGPLGRTVLPWRDYFQGIAEGREVQVP